MANHSSSMDDEIVGINVTPLVDVVLVLLVVLMVTAGYIVSRGIPVDLPHAATGEAVAQPLVLSIAADGRTFLDAAPVSDGELRARIAAARTKQSELRAVIAADGATPHHDVVRVIDLLRQEHITQFAIDVRPEDVENHR